jgi:hypothetical protein
MAEQPEPVDVRPLGVAISRSELRIGDHCNVSVEPRMLGDRTGTYVTYKNVAYRGEEEGLLRFDGVTGPFRFPEWEIVRVVLVDAETGLTQQ